MAKKKYWHFIPPTPEGWVLFFGLVGAMVYALWRQIQES